MTQKDVLKAIIDFLKILTNTLILVMFGIYWLCLELLHITCRPKVPFLLKQSQGSELFQF